MRRIVIVTGGNIGIGLAIAAAFRDSDCLVYEISKTSAGTHGINHIDVDVTEEALVAEAINNIFAKEGRIDIAANCAEYGISGALEYTDLDQAARELELNLFGAANVCKALAPIMRLQGFGRILNISNFTAEMPLPFQGWYAASKAALASLTASFAEEMKPYGVSACTILLPYVNAGFAAARIKNEEGSETYGGRIERSLAYAEKKESKGLNPQTVGKTVAEIALGKRLRHQYNLPGPGVIAPFFHALLGPEGIRGIVYSLYGGEEKGLWKRTVKNTCLKALYWLGEKISVLGKMIADDAKAVWKKIKGSIKLPGKKNTDQNDEPKQ